jgi:hypothetical protein
MASRELVCTVIDFLKKKQALHNPLTSLRPLPTLTAMAAARVALFNNGYSRDGFVKYEERAYLKIEGKRGATLARTTSSVNSYPGLLHQFS